MKVHVGPFEIDTDPKALVALWKDGVIQPGDEKEALRLAAERIAELEATQKAATDLCEEHGTDILEASRKDEDSSKLVGLIASMALRIAELEAKNHDLQREVEDLTAQVSLLTWG